jgi:hypothetical protein
MPDSGLRIDRQYWQGAAWQLRNWDWIQPETELQLVRYGLKMMSGALWLVLVVVLVVAGAAAGEGDITLRLAAMRADLTPDTVAVVPEVLLVGYPVAVLLKEGESALDLRWQAEYGAESTLVAGVQRVPTGEDWPGDSAGMDERLPRSGKEAVEPLGVKQFNGQSWLELMVYAEVLGGDDYLRPVRQVSLAIQERSVAREEVRSAAELRLEKKPARAPLVSGGLEQGGWVVVTSEALAGAFAGLVEHRRALGLTAEVVRIDSVLGACAGEDDAAKLRAFCRDFYEGGGVYVLLAGDETVLPVRYAFPYDVNEVPEADYFQICDLYFADLDGDWDADGDGIYGERLHDAADLEPELRVGRLPINSLAEAVNYVEKIIVYETNPGHGASEYLTRSFFFSSDQLRDYSGGGQHGRIAAAFPDHFGIDTANGVELASGNDANPTNSTAPALMGLLREGWGIVNVLAHGRSDAFAVRTSGYNNWPKSYLMSEPEGPGHGVLGELAGCGKAGFVYSLACDNAAFDKDQPPFNLPNRNVAQDLLSISDGGAVGMVGYSRWGWVATSHYLQKYFFDSLFAHPERPAIDAMYASHRAYPYCRDLVLGQLYLGDPALRVYTEPPVHLIGGVTIAGGAFKARFTDREGTPAAGMVALLSDSSGRLQEFVTDGEGWITLPEDLALGQTYHLAMRGAGTTAAVFSFVPGLVTDVVEEASVRPERFALHQNYPNPFNPTTTIAFDLERRGLAQVSVYNLLGQRVATLVQGELPAGRHAVEWDGRADDGRAVGSGVYVYCLESGARVISRKMVLVK